MPLLQDKNARKVLISCTSIFGIVILLLVFFIPFAFRWFPGIIKSFIFVPHKEIPENMDFKYPENSGFFGGRNFYLTTEDGATIGVWHTLPSNLEDEARNLNLTYMDSERSTQIYNDWLVDATVFFYLHGSAGTRTSPHRLRIYQLLNRLNYHVITFDYRGYGDSTGTPTSETDLIVDTLTVFAWIRDRVAKGNIFIWGHSLGTGVAGHTSVNLASTGDKIEGIVLEAPFNNMADTVRESSIIHVFMFLPWFDYCFIQPLYENDLSFETDRNLNIISTPVLILHAKDDKIVPYELAAKLYENVAGSRKDPNSIQFVDYDSNLGYGHYNIALDPNLNLTIKQFVEKSFD